jgi:hypothetical protein
MDSSAKRSASVTAAAVVAILGSLFLLLCFSAAFFIFLLAKLPGATSELPPATRTMMLGTQGFMICLSLFGVATGIALIYLRNWARISILIWAGFSVFFGVIGIPIAYLTTFSPAPSAPALPAESITAVRLILVFVYGIPLVIGVWWLILFNRKSVKAQFDGVTGAPDAGLPQKPRCPVPIAVLAWLYLTSILNLLILPFFPVHAPVFVFAKLLPDRLGVAVLILTSLAFTVSGIGLLKLKPWSYSLTMGLQIFWLTSSAVSMLRPDYKAVMLSFMEQYRASLHLPASAYSENPFMQHLGWLVVFGMLFAGAILGLLIYYRPRFLEEASRAASTS